MKNNLWKRLASAVIAMCMLVAFVPSAFATETATVETESKAVVYSFLQSTYNSTTITADKISYANGNKNMEYLHDVSTGTTNDMNAAWDGTNKSARFQIYGWGRNDTAYHYVAFKIKGLKMAEYKVAFDYVKYNNNVSARNASVFILDPATTAQILADPENFATSIKSVINKNISSPLFKDINMFADATTTDTAYSTFVPKAEGEHLLVFVNQSPSSYNNRMLFPKSLTFTPIANKIEYNTSAASAFDASKLTYGTTGGHIEYYDTTSDNTTKFGSIAYVTDDFDGHISFLNAGANKWTAFKVRIPEAGDYNLELIYGKHSTATKGAMYLLPVSSTPDIATALNRATPVLASVDFYDAESNATSGLKTGVATGTFTSPAAGEYYMVWKNINNSSWNKGNAMRPARLTLTGGTGLTLIYADIALDKTVFEKDDVATITQGKVFLSNGTETDASGVSYRSTNEEVATISGKTVTAVGYGTAKIQAIREDGYVLDEESIVVESSDLASAFKPENTDEVEIPTAGVVVNTYAYSIDGEVTSVSASENVPAGETYSVTAEEISDYNFLYWAKGTMAKKQIVSYDETYSFIPTVEATHLIAVYEPKSSAETAAKAEFYNGNGQLLETNTTGVFPELPEMAGYGEATGWKCYNNGEIYTGSEAAALSGTMIFVAQYNEVSDDITVTVTNGSGSGTYAYGDVVECVANGSGTFKCWTKDGVIVSTDATYSFNAWKSCEVQAVYGESYLNGNATKILVDAFDGKFIMAEFIGLSKTGAVVEKGIMIGNVRHAMQTNKTQFALEADDEADAAAAVGYAIFADGTMITDK